MAMVEFKQYRPFALYKRGELHYIGMHTDEADCWKFALGWPSPEEIEWAKKNEAAICLPVRVTAPPQAQPTIQELAAGAHYPQVSAYAPAQAQQPAETVWVRDQRGDFEGPQAIDPLVILGVVKPQPGLHGATYSPFVAAKPEAQQYSPFGGGSLPTSPEERHLRRLLAVRVAMPHGYFDDGEAQGQEHGISIDFMREPVGHIDAKLRALNVARAECAKPEAQQPKGLTTERLRQMHHEDEFGLFCDFDDFEQIARAVEQEHGIGASGEAS